jgi:hypothetical protein
VIPALCFLAGVVLGIAGEALGLALYLRKIR